MRYFETTLAAVFLLSVAVFFAACGGGNNAASGKNTPTGNAGTNQTASVPYIISIPGMKDKG
jgi:hypothetical protein